MILAVMEIAHDGSWITGEDIEDVIVQDERVIAGAAGHVMHEQRVVPRAAVANDISSALLPHESEGVISRAAVSLSPAPSFQPERAR